RERFAAAGLSVEEGGESLDCLADRLVVPRVGSQVTLEHDGRIDAELLLLGSLLDDAQEVVAALVREPGDLERVIALGEAVGVVVDGFAGPREQAGGAVLFAQDQVRVALAAL